MTSANALGRTNQYIQLVTKYYATLKRETSKLSLSDCCLSFLAGAVPQTGDRDG